MSEDRHHFVERFLLPTEEGTPAPPCRYNEERGLTVTEEGEPIVDLAVLGDTTTLTEVAGEHDDRDRDDDLKTVTLVQSEGMDHTAAGDGGNAWSGTVTMTKAMGEADDSDEDIENSMTLHGTQTRVQREADDLHAWAATITSTAVGKESDDVD